MKREDRYVHEDLDLPDKLPRDGYGYTHVVNADYADELEGLIIHLDGLRRLSLKLGSVEPLLEACACLGPPNDCPCIQRGRLLETIRDRRL